MPARLIPLRLPPAAGVIFLVGALLAGGCHPEKVGNRIIRVSGRPLTVELARTPQEVARGLQNRDHLPSERGMLFIFPGLRRGPFWMKDTFIPLSIAFIDSSGVIVDILDMEPDGGKELHYSRAPYRYALEVNRGWFKRNEIGIGEHVDLSNLP